jgi:hypothetical protein
MIEITDVSIGLNQQQWNMKIGEYAILKINVVL